MPGKVNPTQQEAMVMVCLQVIGGGSMLHAGLDLSRRRLDVCVISGPGELVEEFPAPPDADGPRYLVEKVNHHSQPVRAVIESMTGARFVHDTLEQLGWDVRIADAQKVKGLAPMACKTDRIDARMLAVLSQRNLVPEIWLPDPRVRSEREQARFRLHLVKHKSMLKHRIHATLMSFGHQCPAVYGSSGGSIGALSACWRLVSRMRLAAGAGGPSRAGSFAARKVRDDLAARRARGESVAPKPKLRFGDAADCWVGGPVVGLRETTQVKYRWMVNQHLRPRFEGRRFDGVNADDLVRLVRELRAEGMSEATVAVILGVISAIYKFAMRRLGWSGTIPTTLMLRSERPKISQNLVTAPLIWSSRSSMIDIREWRGSAGGGAAVHR